MVNLISEAFIKEVYGHFAHVDNKDIPAGIDHSCTDKYDFVNLINDLVDEKAHVIIRKLCSFQKEVMLSGAKQKLYDDFMSILVPVYCCTHWNIKF